MSIQFFVMLYHIKKLIPTTEEKIMLIKELTNRSVSVSTFSKTESVSPLLLSSNSWNYKRRVCLRPSLKICMPKRVTARRVVYSWKALPSRATMATAIAIPSQRVHHSSTRFWEGVLGYWHIHQWSFQRWWDQSDLVTGQLRQAAATKNNWLVRFKVLP